MQKGKASQRRLYVMRVNSNCSPDSFQTQRIISHVNSSGYDTVDHLEEADSVLILSCYLDLEARKQTKSALQEIQRLGKDILLGGCITKMNPPAAKLLTQEYGGKVYDVTVSNNADSCGYIRLTHFNNSPKYHREAEEWQDTYSLYSKAQGLGLQVPSIKTYTRWGYIYSKRLALIEVGRGCLNKCTYCADRYVRGRLKSYSIHEIIPNITSALEMGLSDIALVADDLSVYGLDIGSSFVRLLDSVRILKAKMSLYLDNCNPLYLLQEESERLTEALSNPQVKYITIPIQSIQNRLLRRMGRAYSIEDVSGLISRLKEANRDLVVCTHVIVGFPGETEMDFNKLCDWARCTDIDVVECFDYQEHPNTPAASFSGMIPSEVRSARKAIIDNIFWAKLRKEIQYVKETLKDG